MNIYRHKKAAAQRSVNREAKKGFVQFDGVDLTEFETDRLPTVKFFSLVFLSYAKKGEQKVLLRFTEFYQK